jgi:hypothetical protein
MSGRLVPPRRPSIPAGILRGSIPGASILPAKCGFPVGAFPGCHPVSPRPAPGGPSRGLLCPGGRGCSRSCRCRRGRRASAQASVAANGAGNSVAGVPRLVHRPVREPGAFQAAHPPSVHCRRAERPRAVLPDDPWLSLRGKGIGRQRPPQAAQRPDRKCPPPTARKPLGVTVRTSVRDVAGLSLRSLPPRPRLAQRDRGAGDGDGARLRQPPGRARARAPSGRRSGQVPAGGASLARPLLRRGPRRRVRGGPRRACVSSGPSGSAAEGGGCCAGRVRSRARARASERCARSVGLLS